MNSLNWWQNALGIVVMSSLSAGFTALLGWLHHEPIPAWGYYLAFMTGMILWSRPSYDRQRDFEK